MVEEGLGVALVPALATLIGNKKTYDVNLYKTNLPDRRLVALIPGQYSRVEPYMSFVKSLINAGKRIIFSDIMPMPYILKNKEDSKIL